MHTILIALTMTSNTVPFYPGIEFDDLQMIYAESPSALIQQLQAHNDADLVMLSLEMALDDDLSALSEIRRINASLPVILMARTITVQAVRLAVMLGCKEIMQYPMDNQTFRAIIDKYTNVKETNN